MKPFRTPLLTFVSFVVDKAKKAHQGDLGIFIVRYLLAGGFTVTDFAE